MTHQASRGQWERHMDPLREQLLRDLQSLSPSDRPMGWSAAALIDHLSRFPEEASSLFELVFYGSSDDREFRLFKDLRASFSFRKRKSLILTSVAGGLFCLNLAVFLKPKHVFLFDRNPIQLLMFEFIRKVLLASRDKGDFLSRLENEDYEVPSKVERQLQGYISRKMQLDNKVRPDKAFPGFNRKPLERSWRYALNRFDRLKDLLRYTPYTLLVEDVGNERFVDFLLAQPNHWIYLSNVWTMSDRLKDSSNLEPSPGEPIEEKDAILSYSFPSRIRIRRYLS